jgi:hypothetical protein
MTERWGSPRELILLDGDGHTWIALDYRQAQEDPPVIYIVSLEGDYVTVAHNFEDFIRRMVPFENVYDRDGNLK